MNILIFLQYQSTTTYGTNLERRRLPHTNIADAAYDRHHHPHDARAQEGLQASHMS